MALLHHLDEANARARALDAEFAELWAEREQQKRFTFCRHLIARGIVTDYPIAPTFYRVTTQPKEEP